MYLTRLKALQFGGPAPSVLSADERHACHQLDFSYKHGLADAREMSDRPQTLYGIEASPIGLAAWMLDHDARSSELITRVFAGQREGLTRGELLDNVRPYWLTNTAISLGSFVLGKQACLFGPKGRRRYSCRERLSRCDLFSPAELGREGASQADPFQPAR